MAIWVDADACPTVIKTIIYRAAQRTQTSAIFVANQLLILPRSPYLKAIQVASGFDVADHYIVEHINNEDLVITADIPLAAQVIEKGALALNPRGQLYTEKNIKEVLSTRDLLTSLRDSGVPLGGPASLSQADRQAFANQLDKWLANQPSRFNEH